MIVATWTGKSEFYTGLQTNMRVEVRPTTGGLHGWSIKPFTRDRVGGSWFHVYPRQYALLTESRDYGVYHRYLYSEETASRHDDEAHRVEAMRVRRTGTIV